MAKRLTEITPFSGETVCVFNEDTMEEFEYRRYASDAWYRIYGNEEVEVWEKSTREYLERLYQAFWRNK